MKPVKGVSTKPSRQCTHIVSGINKSNRHYSYRCTSWAMRGIDYCIAHRPDRQPCKAIRANGEPCGGLRKKGSEYCGTHQPTGKVFRRRLCGEAFIDRFEKRI